MAIKNRTFSLSQVMIKHSHLIIYEQETYCLFHSFPLGMNIHLVFQPRPDDTDFEGHAEYFKSLLMKITSKLLEKFNQVNYEINLK